MKKIRITYFVKKKRSLIKITMDMFHAAKKNDLELLKKCVDEDTIDINDTNSKGKRVGHYAVKNNNLEMLQWLVEHGYQIEHKIDYMGYAIGSKEYQIALKGGFFQIFKWLHEKYGFFDVVNSYASENASYYAIKYCNLEMLKWMVKEGYPIDYDEYYLALEEGFFEIFEWLYENVGKFNVSYSIIKFMVREESWVDWAIEKKYQVDQEAMIRAALTGKLNLLQKLYQYYPKINMDICCAACQSGNLEMVKWCFELIKNVRDVEELAYAAVKSGNLILLKWLYERNIKLDSTSEMHNYQIACQTAAKKGYYQMLKWLVKHYHLLISDYAMIIKRIIENQLPEDVNLEILQWLHPYVVTCNPDGYGIITSIIQLYKIKGYNKITKTVCTVAAKNKKFKILKWLVENKYVCDDLSYVVFELCQKLI